MDHHAPRPGPDTPGGRKERDARKGGRRRGSEPTVARAHIDPKRSAADTPQRQEPDWDSFDPGTYGEHNFREIIDAERSIIREGTFFLLSCGIEPGSCPKGVEVGPGPNLYPGMELEPFTQRIDMIERSASNREHLRYLRRRIREGRTDSGQASFWPKFEVCLTGKDERSIPYLREQLERKPGVPGLLERLELWDGSLKRLCEKMKVREGDVWALPKKSYDIGTMFFVADSIDPDPVKSVAALHGFLGSLKPGAPFVAAHMIGSDGYFAGGKFPAANWSLSDIDSAYAGKADYELIPVGASPEVRTESSEVSKDVGMVAAVGRAL